MFDSIFELIRKGEVVIFCGAGTSISAGYPSGAQLAKAIHSNFSDEEKKLIADNLTLAELSEQYVNLKLGKRNALNRILKDIFEKTPGIEGIHHQLVQIPQIKTIITTNYDDLFERAYGNSANVIRSSEDVAYLDSKKVEIFKIHGDFTKIDNILITRSDYTRFFDSSNEELIWTLVKERMATKNVLFMGYNLEDINIESLFRKVSDSLGSHSRECFLLSPNLDSLKVSTLTRQGIQYINTTAELFFVGLVENIKNNITEDFKNQMVDADTFRKVLKNYDLSPTLNAVEDKFILGSVDPTNANPTGEITFNIDPKNSWAIEKLLNIFNQDDIAEVKLEQDAFLNCTLTLNGVKFHSEEGDKFVLMPAPFLSESIDITFGNGNEYPEMPVEVFKTKEHIIFVLKLNTLSFQIKIKPEIFSDPSGLNFKLSVRRDSGYKKAGEEIPSYSFLFDFATTGKIDIFHPGFGKLSYGMMLTETLEKEAEKHLFYFKAIKSVEKYFGVRFGEIKKITQDDYNVLLNMYTLATEGEIINVSKEGFAFSYTDYQKVLLFIEQLKSKKDSNLCNQSDTFESVGLHGVKLALGYRNTQLLQPYVENEQDILDQKTNTILIKSRSNSQRITFNKDKTLPDQTG